MKYRNYEADAVEEIDRETIAMMPEAVKHVGQVGSTGVSGSQTANPTNVMA